MKMGGWYISVLLMTGILILIVVRLALFVACWFGGADFWLYPNLFADDLGPIDSFRPLYTFRYRNDDWIMVAARIFSVLLSVAAVFKLGETHSFRDIGQFGRQQFLDVVDWGYQKLSNESDELITPEGLKIEPINEFLDENGLDFSCMRKCRFSSWIEVREECLFDCDCAVELVNGPCFKKCTKEVQTKIEEIHRDVCLIRDDDDDDDDDDEDDPLEPKTEL
ncbi:MAG: uncharacterized protein KVP18_003626 [Porospora cf. gigantea A]|uniref:uncharacterized protein n=1 Tax=Porospora cf. gigantea A TaxID=2853593 RepID=UPI00355AB589|nr:MAG: hypothetical protein KVP18_003626 [Porospora cf. gigantea A]